MRWVMAAAVRSFQYPAMGMSREEMLGGRIRLSGAGCMGWMPARMEGWSAAVMNRPLAPRQASLSAVRLLSEEYTPR
jgi:hypothetical protein